MNKAFVRDPEPPDPCCPERNGCGALGVPVEAETLRAQLGTEAPDELQGRAWYCPNPACDVAYFDALGGVIGVDRLAQPAWPKPSTAPLCNCLGIRAEEIVEEARRGCRDRIRELVAEAEGRAHRCACSMPAGRPCVTAARRLFLANFEPA